MVIAGGAMTIINATYSGVRFASGVAETSRNQWTSIRSLKRAAFQQRRGLGLQQRRHGYVVAHARRMH